MWQPVEDDSKVSRVKRNRAVREVNNRVRWASFNEKIGFTFL